MINDSNIGGMSGAPVHGPDDRKIGTVGQVFVDPDTGMPNWITVHTGLFGRRESFVPLDGATWDNEVIRVAIDKDTIKEAPRIDAGEPLTPENEADLYRYYTLQATDAAGGEGETAPGANTATDAVPGPPRSRLRQYERPATGAEPTVSEPTGAEPTVSEPTVAEPTVSEPTGAEPTVAETTVAESTASEPDPQAGHSDSAEAGAAAQTESGTAQPRGRHVKLD